MLASAVSASAPADSRLCPPSNDIAGAALTESFDPAPVLVAVVGVGDACTVSAPAARFRLTAWADDWATGAAAAAGVAIAIDNAAASATLPVSARARRQGWRVEPEACLWPRRRGLGRRLPALNVGFAMCSFPVRRPRLLIHPHGADPVEGSHEQVELAEHRSRRVAGSVNPLMAPGAIVGVAMPERPSRQQGPRGQPQRPRSKRGD